MARSYLSVRLLSDVNVLGSVGLTPPLVVSHLCHQLQVSLWLILFFIYTQKTHTTSFTEQARWGRIQNYSFICVLTAKIQTVLTQYIMIVMFEGLCDALKASELYPSVVWTPNLRRDRRCWRSRLPSVYWRRRSRDRTEPTGRRQWGHTQFACGSEEHRRAGRSTDLMDDQRGFTHWQMTGGGGHIYTLFCSFHLFL